MNRNYQKIRETRDKCEEQRIRESEMAQCECGAQVRKDIDGVWTHIGPCGITSGAIPAWTSE